MKRAIVLGGLGLFGRMAVEQLRTLGIAALTASRRGRADFRIDANDATSIRAILCPDDLVIDAAGPFQSRSLALVEAAIELGFDIIDLNDSWSYAERVMELATQLAAAKIRVLNAASTVSAVSAAVLRQSGVIEPVRVTAFLAPATRITANAGVARSLMESVGRPIRVRRGGGVQTLPGWSESRKFPMPQPVGEVRGRLFETADAVHLPTIWPTLQDVTMYVDTNTPGLNTVIRAVAAIPGLPRLVARHMSLAAAVARTLGSSAGGVAYEIEDSDGKVVRYALVARGNSHLTAVAPVVLAARAIAEARFPHRGLVPPDRHVAPTELFGFLQTNGITLVEVN